MSFTCLIALTGAFITVLNTSGGSGHPCLVAHFRGKAFSFSPLSTTLVVTMVYNTFNVLFNLVC